MLHVLRLGTCRRGEGGCLPSPSSPGDYRLSGIIGAPARVTAGRGQAGRRRRPRSAPAAAPRAQDGGCRPPRRGVLRDSGSAPNGWIPRPGCVIFLPPGPPPLFFSPFFSVLFLFFGACYVAVAVSPPRSGAGGSAGARLHRAPPLGPSASSPTHTHFIIITTIIIVIPLLSLFSPRPNRETAGAFCNL